MKRITVYLDDIASAQVTAAARAARVSRSQWIAEAIRLRIGRDWPASVRELAGAWPDFPTAEEIRRKQAGNARRERL